MPRETRPSARERALDAAKTLVLADEPVTMEAVAAGAGVSRATLYRCFATVGALNEALLAERGLVVDPRDSRQRALDALLMVLAQNGRAGLTMERVAEAAGLSPVTLYRIFGDRAGMLRALAETHAPRAQISALLPPNEAELTAWFEQLAAIGIRSLRRLQPMVLLAFDPDPEVQALVRAVRQRDASTRTVVAQQLASLMERGLLRREDPMVVAQHFLGLVFAEALLIPAMGQPSSSSPEEAARAITRTLLNGLLPRA